MIERLENMITLPKLLHVGEVRVALLKKDVNPETDYCPGKGAKNSRLLPINPAITYSSESACSVTEQRLPAKVALHLSLFSLLIFPASCLVCTCMTPTPRYHGNV